MIETGCCSGFEGGLFLWIDLSEQAGVGACEI